MKTIIRKIIDFFFLTKEITSKEGEVHFRRYRLFACPWLRFYIHQILVSDYDDHFHDHPWNFRSQILKGSYREDYTRHPVHFIPWYAEYKTGDVVVHGAQDSHKITLTSPEVWTFVIAWGCKRPWGYRYAGSWIGHKEYRQLKNEGKL